MKASYANLYTFIRLVVGDGVSDREFARRAGLSWRSFLSLKQGKRVSPRVAELGSIANALDVDPALLFEAARGTPAELLHAALARPGSLAQLVLPKACHNGDAAHDSMPVDGVMRLSVEYLRHGVCGLDLDGRIVAANRALSALTGHSATRLRRMSLWDVVVPSHRPRVAQELVETYTSGLLHELSTTLVSRDSSKIAVLIDGTRIDGHDGSPVGLQLLVRHASDARPDTATGSSRRPRKR